MTKRSYSNMSAPGYNPNGLFDIVMANRQIKNDAALAVELDVAPSVVSKIRHHALPVGPTMLIRVHDITGMTLNTIRAYLGIPVPDVAAPAAMAAVQ